MVVSDDLKGLHWLIDLITYYSQQYNLYINIQKTKQMIISKEVMNGAHLFINGTKIEKVNQYSYLGAIINEQWDNA